MFTKLPVVKDKLAVKKYLCSYDYCYRRRLVRYLSQFIICDGELYFISCTIPPIAVQEAVEKRRGIYYTLGRTGINVAKNIFELDNYSDSNIYVFISL